MLTSVLKGLSRPALRRLSSSASSAHVICVQTGGELSNESAISENTADISTVHAAIELAGVTGKSRETPRALFLPHSINNNSINDSINGDDVEISGNDVKKIGSRFVTASVGDSKSLGGDDPDANAIVRDSVADAFRVASSIKGVREVFVDASVSARAAAEGAHLASHSFSLKTVPLSADEIEKSKEKLETKKNRAKSRGRPEKNQQQQDEKNECLPKRQLKTASQDHVEPSIHPVCLRSDTEHRDWFLGTVLAESQNIARRLMETPSNMMTPEDFAAHAVVDSIGLGGVEVVIRDESWIEDENFAGLLAVSRGSEAPPRVVEISYMGDPDASVACAIVGKGVTFDSGGISIKPSAGMEDMKADMGGAAVAVAVVNAVARLRLPINVVAVCALCENMPSGAAQKPGDVTTTRAGINVVVDNTDAEGRLVLADALDYTLETYRPWALIDVATLTGAMHIALGEGAAGFFTRSDDLANELHKAGHVAGDPLWRMPLLPIYDKQIDSQIADATNSAGRAAGACTAAAFLHRFVPEGSCERYAHIDIAGVMKESEAKGAAAKGMSGRPVRAIVQWIMDAAPAGYRAPN